ncbi:hypothetical protein [Tenacibaculum ovolyticum]|uniref:hypothetical protein n=1 Tax=Tenacibaculum ovolyticum TaxID=104270 RepID=UPI0007EDED98|nr:hypothetical protein [Tenacibaculum ovolyticum]
MKEFEKIIGKKMIKVNYTYNYPGFDNYSENPDSDFEYLPFGGLHIKLSNNETYCIADYNRTTNDTDAVGIKKIIEKQTNLTDKLIPERITKKWAKYFNQKIIGFKVYIKKENIISFTKKTFENELYYESLELNFENGKSIYYFCGDVDYYNESIKRYELLTGRDCGIIFFNKKDFDKYELSKVERIEKYGLQQS